MTKLTPQKIKEALGWNDDLLNVVMKDARMAIAHFFSNPPEAEKDLPIGRRAEKDWFQAIEWLENRYPSLIKKDDQVSGLCWCCQGVVVNC